MYVTGPAAGTGRSYHRPWRLAAAASTVGWGVFPPADDPVVTAGRAGPFDRGGEVGAVQLEGCRARPSAGPSRAGDRARPPGARRRKGGLLDDAVEVCGESACRFRNVGREVEVVAEIDNEHDRDGTARPVPGRPGCGRSVLMERGRRSGNSVPAYRLWLAGSGRSVTVRWWFWWSRNEKFGWIVRYPAGPRS